MTGHRLVYAADCQFSMEILFGDYIEGISAPSLSLRGRSEIPEPSVPGCRYSISLPAHLTRTALLTYRIGPGTSPRSRVGPGTSPGSRIGPGTSPGSRIGPALNPSRAGERRLFWPHGSGGRPDWVVAVVMTLTGFGRGVGGSERSLGNGTGYWE